MLISEAFAQAAAPAQSESSLMGLLPLFGIFLIFYFLLIRPQAKRAKEHKQLIEDLQRGDEVITNGGILGLLTNVSESYVIVEIAPNNEVTVLKSSIQTLLPKGTLKSIEPPKSSKRKTTKNTANLEDKKAQETENKVGNDTDNATEDNKKK